MASAAHQRAALAGVLLLTACAAPPTETGEPGESGSLTLTVDNDSYDLDDGNYTNGVTIAWVSPEVSHYPEESRLRRVTESVGRLLGADDETEQHLSIAASQLVFTPENINVPNPRSDQHPYLGFLSVDTTFFARETSSLTSLTIRLGVTGEVTMAEEFQKEVHEWFGSDRPRGWDHQVKDEPVFNLGLERHERFHRGSLGEYAYDLTANAGGAVGTYFTGANLGAELRLGRVLPRDIGSRTMNTGFETTPLVYRPSATQLDSHVFLGAEGYRVERYLPVDGGYFRDGRSADREAWVQAARVGFTVGQGSLALTFAFTLHSDTYEAQDRLGQYGTIALAWFP